MGYKISQTENLRISKHRNIETPVRRFPAEWEKQSATWLAWPHNEKEWGKRLTKIREFYVELINLILQFQDVKLILANEVLLQEVQTYFKDKINPKSKICNSKLHFVVIPNNDVWIRDYGPFFLQLPVTSGKLQGKEKIQNPQPKIRNVIVSFEFNAWGEKYPPYDLDNNVPKNIAMYLGEPCESYPFVLEGGAIDFNGDGLAITTEECLLNKNRNSNLKKGQFEDILKSVFNLQKIIWLKCGLKDDHTDGHIDNVARFIDSNKLLINEPVTKELKLIENTAAKCNLEICKLPFPDVDRNKIPSASYLNFIFVNGGIIVPTFNCKSDNVALNTFQKIFPKRKVLGIDSSLLIQEGGGLHCISKQESSL